MTERIHDWLLRRCQAGEILAGWDSPEVAFELQQQEMRTILRVTHYNWKKVDNFLAHRSTR